MNKEETTNYNQRENGKRRIGIITLSLIINVLLASGFGYLYKMNQQLASDLTDYNLKVNELSQTIVNLEQQLNMSKVQLNHYRDLSEYYSTLATSPSNASSIIGKAAIPVLAVQQSRTFIQTQYIGFVLHAELELQAGEGRILVNTEIINGVDIQTSVRIATTVVEELLGVSFSNTDIILTISSSDQTGEVDGLSAGGSITVAIIAALEHANIMEGIYMTGTIMNDGKIGSVGGVPYKALAAAEDGAQKILVPVGQGSVIMYEPITVKVGRFVYTTYEKVVVDLEDYLSDSGFSVDVVEVETVFDAYDIFTG
jgi:uncharacterized protein